ncbi:MAG: hypothetical protein F6K35_43905 [Okeania sp. SIO2H7]|nr:hypothetical protein [Okeania sp. SIO2H7]
MENLQLNSERQINSLTVAELENLIFKIVRRVIKQEMSNFKSTKTPPQEFLDTFGSWEDSRTAEEIIEDIYASRTFSDRQESL